MVAVQVQVDQMQAKAWERVWELQAPQPLNLSQWQAQRDRLASAAVLFLRRALESPICPICQEAVEFNLHALRGLQGGEEILGVSG